MPRCSMRVRAAASARAAGGAARSRTATSAGPRGGCGKERCSTPEEHRGTTVKPRGRDRCKAGQSRDRSLLTRRPPFPSECGIGHSRPRESASPRCARQPAPRHRPIPAARRSPKHRRRVQRFSGGPAGMSGMGSPSRAALPTNRALRLPRGGTGRPVDGGLSARPPATVARAIFGRSSASDGQPTVRREARTANRPGPRRGARRDCPSHPLGRGPRFR